MGKKIDTNRLSFVSFAPKDKHFIAFLAIEGLDASKGDPELALRKAANIYEEVIKRMRSIIDEIKTCRANRKAVSARRIWHLGNIIFSLKDDLEKISFQIDNLYLHLVRDLRVKRKWLEKVIILRRYLTHEHFIPKTLNWGACEKGTRQVAEKLREQSCSK